MSNLIILEGIFLLVIKIDRDLRSLKLYWSEINFYYTSAVWILKAGACPGAGGGGGGGGGAGQNPEIEKVKFIERIRVCL